MTLRCVRRGHVRRNAHASSGVAVYCGVADWARAMGSLSAGRAAVMEGNGGSGGCAVAVSAADASEASRTVAVWI